MRSFSKHRLAGKKRDAHGSEIAGRDKTALGNDLPFHIRRWRCELEFRLKTRRDAGQSDRGPRRLHAGQVAQVVERPVNPLCQRLHVRRFPPPAADVKRQNVTGIKTG